MREHSRKIALCGLSSALALVFLLLGGIVPLATFACPMLAMLALIPAAAECGFSLAMASYGAAAALGLLLVPDKEIACLFLFLGYYPALRPRLSRLRPALLRTLCKLAIGAVSVAGAYALLLFVFRLETLAAEFAGLSRLLLGGMLVLGAATFLLFDEVLDRFTRLWLQRTGRRRVR